MIHDKKLLICSILFPLLVISFAYTMFVPNSGNAVTHINCYAVDSYGRLYLQSEDNRDDILLYENGKYVGTIHLDTSLENAKNSFSSRGSFFTIMKDVIYVTTSTYVYQLDLQGNMLDSYKDITNLHGRLITAKKYIADNGDLYQKRNVMFRTSIVKNNEEVIYQIPVRAAILKWVEIISVVLFAVVVITVVVHFRKEQYR